MLAMYVYVKNVFNIYIEKTFPTRKYNYRAVSNIFRVVPLYLAYNIFVINISLLRIPEKLLLPLQFSTHGPIDEKTDSHSDIML